MKSDYILLLIILLIGIIFISGCVTQESPTTIDNNKGSTSEDFCRSMIPERIKLQCNTGDWADHSMEKGNSQCFSSNETKVTWNDGTSIGGTIWFSQGERTGENVNYLYSSQYLSYEKTLISAEGTVGEKVSYRFMMVLDPNDQNAEGFKLKSYKCCKNTKYNHFDIL